MSQQNTLRFPVQAGMMVPMCPTRFGRNQRCDGIMRIPITLKEVAKIRNGKNKSLTANFSCKCNWEKVVIHN